MFRKLLSLLPRLWQDELRRFRFIHHARNGNFSPNEPEAGLLSQLVSAGDWVIDIGANVGQYTLLLSHLVGPSGRVLAFEPITATAATLASVCARCAPWQNISVFNLAASGRTGTLSFHLPVDQAGLNNYERAHAREGGATSVLATTIDALQLPHRISLVKVDAEGHENPVLFGMRETIARDLPILIVEDNGTDAPEFLSHLGYRPQKIKDNSPNIVYIAHSTERE